MKLTNGTIYNATKALQKLKETPLPIKTSYKISKNAKTLLQKTSFIEEQRVSLVKKYGVESEEGMISVTPENAEMFAEEYNELMAIEEEVDIQMVDIDELNDVKLTSNELETISFLIDMEE